MARVADGPAPEQILQALRKVQDPDLHRDIVSLGFVRNLLVREGAVSFDINLTTPACPVKERMKQEAIDAVRPLPGVRDVQVNMTAEVRATAGLDTTALAGVRNIVAIGSGKGGVGKSTVSANVAVALARDGARVGLLDADIYGPSVPTLMGLLESPPPAGPRMQPAERHGIRFTSMGFMAPGDQPLIWRGPMAHKALQQCLFGVDWGELDYLIVDLPPGTGDVHLTLAQSVPLTGAAIVSTPQDLGLMISKKTLRMLETTKVPILGIVENMSSWVCSHCGKSDDVFGHGTVRKEAERLRLPFLGEIPLDAEIRRASDAGMPVVATSPSSKSAQALFRVARNLAAQVSTRNYHAAQDPAGAAVLKKILHGAGPRLSLAWADGHESHLPAAYLRRHCPCATCVSENTGVRTLDPRTIPDTIEILRAQPVGQYALSFAFSDGHETGIYTFETLRSLCPCPACQAQA